MNWLPFFGFRELDEQAIKALDLDVGWRWSALQFEWLGYGWLFFARPLEPKQGA